MKSDRAKDLGVFIFLLVCGAVLSAAVIAVSLEPDQYTIELSEPMTVAVSDDGNFHWTHVMTDEEFFCLKEGDKLIVTSEPTRGFIAPGKGGAYTHVRGWLLDGTRVDVPLNELREQEGWRTRRQSSN